MKTPVRDEYVSVTVNVFFERNQPTITLESVADLMECLDDQDQNKVRI